VEEVEPRVRFAATMPAADVAHRPGRRWFGVNSAPVSVGVMGLRLVDLSGHLLVRENHGGRVLQHPATPQLTSSGDAVVLMLFMWLHRHKYYVPENTIGR
jgi:hypothetical protein